MPACYYHYRRESGESLFSRFHPDTYEIHFRVYGKKRQVMERMPTAEMPQNVFANYAMLPRQMYILLWAALR